MDMNINRNKLSIVSLFMITTFFWIFPVSIHAASRGISVISDLSHQSGKLGEYRALVIGINDYKDPKIPDLETAVNDAQAMATLLRERYGFQVELLLDRKATRKAIYQGLRNLALSTKPDENVLIYYAGHGDLDRLTNDGWWIPSDAEGGDPVTYLNNFLVQTYIRSMKARHVLLVSDSCYSGTLFGQTRAMPQVIEDKYYLNLYNEKSRWGMTSGNKTPVSDRSTGSHSVFAYQLLKELRNSEKPYISTQELYTRIAPIISNNSEQTPLCRPILHTGDQGGEFVFVASMGAAIEKPILVKPETVVMPGQTETALDDILKASEKKRQAVESWNKWQQAREHEYRQVNKIDKDAYLSPDQKAAAWQRFLAAVTQDNPYSQQDDEMRTNSRSRLNHWQSVKPMETKSSQESSKIAMGKKPPIAPKKSIANSLGMEFVYIQPGTFMMGSPSNESGRDNDEKQHRLTLTKGFYMQTTEVTQGQWKAVMGSNPSYFKNCGDNCPVEEVSWKDIQQFIRKLNQRESSGTYRLPTEAEWEYAARAGTDTPFFFGRCLSTDQANYDGNNPLSGCSKGEYRKRTISVASFRTNSWGLYDMHGNVWEWCQDWFGEYPSSSVTNPTGPSGGSRRVVRGGSWLNHARVCRSADRYSDAPGRRYAELGFRLLRNP